MDHGEMHASSYCSNKFDPFLDLSLEIYRTDSLIKALKHFTAVEQLDGGAKQYQCQRCQEKVRAYKQLTIHNAPYVLTIHLKRFGPTNEKIDKRVSFETTLNLKPFVSDQQEGDLKYTLYGVLVHNGYNTHSGHYYCYVRTSTGVWHRLDDNKVRPVSEKDVLSEKAYMLFYVRDRSSVNKRSADVLGDNIMTNFPKHQAITQPIMNGTLQNAEKKTIITEIKPTNTSCVQPLFITVDSKNGDDVLKANAVIENTVHVLTRDTNLKENNQVASNGLQQTSCHINNEKQYIGHADSIPIDKIISNNTHCEKDEERLIKVDGAMNTSSKMPIAENVLEKNDITVKKDRVGKKPKLNKICKSWQYFGRKQLFFASLSVNKKKHKKCKKQCLVFKHIVKDKTDDQMVSTSDSGNPVDVFSACEPPRRNCSGANKEIKIEEAKNSIFCKGDFVHDRKISSCSNNEVMPVTSNQSIVKSSIVAEQDTTSLLKSLKQTTVPHWDDVELPPVQVNYMDDEWRNKRSRYDDWDEALDQGKRKKLKKSKNLWNGEYNPFQEVANEQLHLKVEHRSFGNQPMRI